MWSVQTLLTDMAIRVSNACGWLVVVGGPGLGKKPMNPYDSYGFVGFQLPLWGKDLSLPGRCVCVCAQRVRTTVYEEQDRHYA